MSALSLPQSDPIPGARSQRSTRRWRRIGPAAYLLMGLLPLLFAGSRWVYWQHQNLNPDAISYWSVGRSLATGGGFHWPIKPYFYPDDGRVVQPVIGYLSVLFTLLLGGLQRVGLGFRHCEVVVSLFALVDAWLVFLLARRLCRPSLAAIGALLFVVNPEAVIASSTLWTEPMALALVLGAYLVASHSFLSTPGPAADRPGLPAASDRVRIQVPKSDIADRPSRVPHKSGVYRSALTCGILLGLAYLTRPAEIVYIAILGAAAFFYGGRRTALALSIGVLAMLAPYWAADWYINGSPFFTMYGVLTRTVFYGEAMYTGFGRHYPSSIALLTYHWPAISSQIVRNFRLCMDLLAEPGNLGVMIIAVGVSFLLSSARAAPGVTGCADRSAAPQEAAPSTAAGPVLIALTSGALINLLLSGLLWSTHEEARFLFSVWTVGLLVSLALIERAHLVSPRALQPRPVPPASPGIDPAHLHGDAANEPIRTAGHVPYALIVGVIALVGTLSGNVVTLRTNVRASFGRRGHSWRESQARRYQALSRTLPVIPGALPGGPVVAASGPTLAASDPWMANYVTGYPTVLFPALRKGELPAFLARYHPGWIAADDSRMPEPTNGDDFGGLVRSSQESRDWKLRWLVHDPLLEEHSLPGNHGRLRLYRVLYPAVLAPRPRTRTGEQTISRPPRSH